MKHLSFKDKLNADKNSPYHIRLFALIWFGILWALSGLAVDPYSFDPLIPSCELYSSSFQNSPISSEFEKILSSSFEYKGRTTYIGKTGTPYEGYCLMVDLKKAASNEGGWNTGGDFQFHNGPPTDYLWKHEDFHRRCTSNGQPFKTTAHEELANLYTNVFANTDSARANWNAMTESERIMTMRYYEHFRRGFSEFYKPNPELGKRWKLGVLQTHLPQKLSKQMTKIDVPAAGPGDYTAVTKGQSLFSRKVECGPHAPAPKGTKLGKVTKVGGTILFTALDIYQASQYFGSEPNKLLPGANFLMDHTNPVIAGDTLTGGHRAVGIWIRNGTWNAIANIRANGGNVRQAIDTAIVSDEERQKMREAFLGIKVPKPPVSYENTQLNQAYSNLNAASIW